MFFVDYFRRRKQLKDLEAERKEAMRYSTSFSGVPPDEVIINTIKRVKTIEDVNRQARAERETQMRELERQTQLQQDRELREQTERQLERSASLANQEFFNNH